jgi:hypothetical protein
MNRADNTSLHTDLIKANIALFKGERAETQRLLQGHIIKNSRTWKDDSNATMIIWLQAQSQNNLDERIKHLELLVANTDSDDYYGQMAQDYLQEEDNYQQKINPRRRRFSGIALGVPWWKAFILMLLGGVITFAGLNILNDDSPQPAAQDTTLAANDEQHQPTLDAPDKSQILVPDSYTARYPQGIMQIAAIEDNSERVTDAGQQLQILPVPGARFYALNIIFECRGLKAICDEPPEAELTLKLADDRLVATRADVSIAGESVFEPIALGRTTTGWVVFEIPLISTIDTLIIMPADEDGTATPVVIELHQQP